MKEGGGEVILKGVIGKLVEKGKLDYMVMECGGWLGLVRVKGVRGGE